MSNDRDNRANQLNPNNSAYWTSRGYDGRPPEGGYTDDDDDSRLPYEVNIPNRGIGYRGLQRNYTPVSCLSKEMQQQAEQFRVEFLKIAENVIKPEMDKYVWRLAALNIQSEARNTVLAEYCQQGWPFVELTFRRSDGIWNVTQGHVKFFCMEDRRSEIEVGARTAPAANGPQYFLKRSAAVNRVWR